MANLNITVIIDLVR